MLHVGIAPYETIHNISDNMSEKLKEYFEKEAGFYVRYVSIIDHLRLLLNNIDDETNDFYIELRRSVLSIYYLLDEVYKKDSAIQYTRDNILEYIHNYMDIFKSPESIDYINIINTSIKNNKHIYASDKKYSFRNGVNILRRNKISPQEATSSIILMLYARDYFNIKSILVLREYLLNSKIIMNLLDMSKLKKNPGNDFLGLLFSDYVLIDNILDLYARVSNSELLKSEIPLEENSELNRENFDFICMIIYARYITSILLFIVEFDIHGYFENEKIDYILLKIYRSFSLIILNSVYRSLSIFEFTLFSNLEILNDVCIHTHRYSSKTKLEKANKIVSSIAGDAGHKKYDDIINKIMKVVIRKLDNGCTDSHPKMLKLFKDSPEYRDYFDKKKYRGFERNLRKELIQTYIQRGLPVVGINGAGVSRSSKNDKTP